MGNYTIIRCSKILGEVGKQEIFATNVPKILDLKSSSEQIFFRKLSLAIRICVDWAGNLTIPTKRKHEEAARFPQQYKLQKDQPKQNQRVG